MDTNNLKNIYDKLKIFAYMYLCWEGYFCFIIKCVKENRFSSVKGLRCPGMILIRAFPSSSSRLIAILHRRTKEQILIVSPQSCCNYLISTFVCLECLVNSNNWCPKSLLQGSTARNMSSFVAFWFGEYFHLCYAWKLSAMCQNNYVILEEWLFSNLNSE